MPTFPQGPQYQAPGSGISKRSRLAVQQFPGHPDTLLTVAQGNQIIKQVQEWANRLEFGRVGFQVATNVQTSMGGIATGTPVTFDETIQDTNRFTKLFEDPDLTYFQIPEGLARQYALSYQLLFDIPVLTNVVKTYTGAVQTFTVPAGVTELTIRCDGAAGGYKAIGFRVNGGQAIATFSVTPGTVYDVYVGGAGGITSVAGGWPNGGNGDAVSGSQGNGGGGSTDVRPTGTTMASALVVGGGGGGQGDGAPAHQSMGGAGGYPAGDPGLPASAGVNGGVNPGLGGTQTLPGAGGPGSADPGDPGDVGSQGQGGSAGNTTNNSAFPPGGGGGGWHGGGGAGADTGSGSAIGGGGGGGSSHVATGARNVTYSNASVTGNGAVVFTYYVHNPAAATDVVSRLYVNYKHFNATEDYATTIQVCGDAGVSPHGTATMLPLNPGDRIYLQVDVAKTTLAYQYATLALWSLGE